MLKPEIQTLNPKPQTSSPKSLSQIAKQDGEYDVRAMLEQARGSGGEVVPLTLLLKVYTRCA